MKAPTRLIPHRAGTTRAVYSKDGQFIYTTGADCVVRRFKIDSNEEPLLLDPLHEDGVTSIALSNTHLVTCSEDATVAIFDLKDHEESSKICRSTLPCREVAISPDGEWVAMASDETKVKIVNVANMLQVMELSAALAKSIKHIAFHPSGNMISTVDTNGAIRIYSLSTEQPSIIETLSGIVPIVHSTESPVSCKVAWHPDGTCFAAPMASREIGIYDRMDWKRVAIFKSSDGHLGAITDISWSPNGAYLASAAQDKKIIIWEGRTQQIVQKLDLALYALQVVWHTRQNTLSWTTDQGELHTVEELLSADADSSFERPLRSSPAKILQQAQQKATTTTVSNASNGHSSRLNKTAAYVDDEALSDLEDAGAEWIVDDDGAGYIPNADQRKRPIGGAYKSDDPERSTKRSRYSGEFLAHERVQHGSTPWRNRRRYLTLNMIGWIWTVEQDDHNTVTVEFHDREAHRQYHFNDPALYSFAVLDDLGAFFASPIRVQDGIEMPATIHYRPHESWAAYSNWSITLPPGEDVEAIALSHSGVVLCSSKGYIRTYTLHGLPKQIFHTKYAPIIGAISFEDMVMIVANGPVSIDGSPSIVYMIFDTKNGRLLQNNDIVALEPKSAIKSLFFGEDGNPYIYTTKGVLSMLVNWLASDRGQWIPMLDTNLLQRRIGKDENYWPVAVAQNKFHCIILKGAERHPYFPRPVTSEFDFLMPITVPDYVDKSQASLEISFAQDSLLARLADDQVLEDETAPLRALADRSLLQLLNLACKNEQDARALDICQLLSRPQSLDAAVKVAGHHSRFNLADRIGRIVIADDC